MGIAAVAAAGVLRVVAGGCEELDPAVLAVAVRAAGAPGEAADPGHGLAAAGPLRRQGEEEESRQQLQQLAGGITSMGAREKFWRSTTVMVNSLQSQISGYCTYKIL